MKITFLDAATLGEDLIAEIPALFGGLGDIVVRRATAQDEAGAAIADSEAIIVNKIKLNGSNLEKCKKLKLICVAATGFDNIDIEYCKSRGIAVCNVVGYSTHSVAQVAAAMALYLLNHLPEYTDFVNTGEYTKSKLANRLVPVYHEAAGKVWGIVGFGNIGRQTAKIAEALGCKIIVCKRTPDKEYNCVDIDTLCKKADIISVHTPLTEETNNLISRERIALMKQDAIFINVARGAVADETALADAILQSRLGGLGVDVYSEEPFSKEHPYTKLLYKPNVCFTPHMAWGSYEARIRCLRTIRQNIDVFLSGGRQNRLD